MNSTYISFPEKNQITLCSENRPVPADNEVLVKTHKSLISTGTESLCLRGVFDPGTNWESWVKYPFRPGYSVAGEVVEVGASVKRYQKGDRVFANSTHSLYACIREDNPQLVLLPEWVSYDEATWVALAITAQLGVRRAELKLGESVGVVGLGMLGQLVIQYMSQFGVRHLVAVDTVATRIEFAKKHGATHGLLSDAGTATKSIKDITNGAMLDVAFDVTGHPAVLAPAIGLTRQLGKIILLGDTSTPSQQVLGPGVVSDSRSVLGIHISMYPRESTPFNPWTFSEMTALFFDYLRRGRMNVKDLITHEFNVSEAPEVYQWLCSRREEAMGVLLNWE